MNEDVTNEVGDAIGCNVVICVHDHRVKCSDLCPR